MNLGQHDLFADADAGISLLAADAPVIPLLEQEGIAPSSDRVHWLLLSGPQLDMRSDTALLIRVLAPNGYELRKALVRALGTARKVDALPGVWSL